jgi:hypothetical protein
MKIPTPTRQLGKRKDAVIPNSDREASERASNNVAVNYERFQHVRDELSKQGFSLPLPTGN